MDTEKSWAEARRRLASYTHGRFQVICAKKYTRQAARGQNWTASLLFAVVCLSEFLILVSPDLELHALRGRSGDLR